jgi:hypothetical protein
MLIITARDPLVLRYGSIGYDRLRAALDTWAVVDADRVLAVDDPADMQNLGLAPGVSTPTGVQSAIREVYRRFPSLASSVLIAGGNSIVPFVPIPNPVQDRSVDPDNTVLSDNPYGALVDSLQEQLAPTLPVGRLAAPDAAPLNDFIALIEGLPHRAQGTTVGQPGSALVINDDWTSFSGRVAIAMPEPQVWHIAPGYEMNSATRQDAARSVLYFNLHGFTGDPDWKCWSDVQRNFISTVTPDGLDRSCVGGSLSFAECCYGAQIAGRTADNSCALKLVREGANFIGATGLAFGSYIASDLMLEDADFLARAFFASVQGGQPVGSALRTAQKLYFNDAAEARSGDVWQYKQKTLLQFVLLGNPQTVH